MKRLFRQSLCCFFLLAAFAEARAQSDLVFNKRFVESEDHWVALKGDKDTSYDYGFIYIDDQAGLTLDFGGTFIIAKDGSWKGQPGANRIKYRLQNNNVVVAFIPAERLSQLNLTATPDWLHYYKTDTVSAKYLYTKGFRYNGWDQCAKALGYLERARALDAAYPGLLVELAFSYNCLQRFDEASAVLQQAQSANPTDAYTNKELVYTLIHKGDIKGAEAAYRQALKKVKDPQYNGENILNILGYYYQQKDKANFNRLLEEARQVNKDNKQMTAYIDQMVTELR